MFSAKKFVDELNPHERARLINYIARPYLIRVAIEMGLDDHALLRRTWTIDDLMGMEIRMIRNTKIEIDRLHGVIKNQKKEIERRAQVAFTFMEKHNEQNN